MGAVESGCEEGSLFPLPPRNQKGYGVTTEARRSQGPSDGPPVAGVGHLTPGVQGRAYVGVRARVFRSRVRGLCVRVCAVRARVPRVCTGLAAAGARPCRGSACPSLCAPARRSAASPPAKSVHAWGE